MGALNAINLLISLVSSATNALGLATQVSGLIKMATAENRDITAAELDAIVATDDTARKLLKDAIDRAK